MVTHKKTLLTERETAAFLGVSVSLIRKWRVEGQGGPDYFKIARAVRYDEDAIKSFLEVRRVSGNHGREPAQSGQPRRGGARHFP